MTLFWKVLIVLLVLNALWNCLFRWASAVRLTQHGEQLEMITKILAQLVGVPKPVERA